MVLSEQTEQTGPVSVSHEKMSKYHRLFLVDDHVMLREGLRVVVERQKDLTVVGEAAGGRMAYERVRQLLPDLVLMDISLGGWSGIRTTEKIKAECPQIKVLGFSMHEDRGYVRELFQVGANGYLLKSSSAEEITKAIRSVLSGGVYVDPKLGNTLLALLKQPQPSPISKGETLSEREHIVLKQVSQGYANKEIAAQLGISIKTVETHRARAMNKLALDSRVDLVHHALKQGWLSSS